MFVARDYEFSNYVKLHNYFAGLFGRKDFLRVFCSRNGIDYKPVKGKRYVMPANYLIEHRELNFLNGVRNKIVASFYDDYEDIQLMNLKAHREKVEEIKQQNEIVQEAKNQNDYYRAKLTEAKRKKNSISIIHFQSMLSSQKVKIKNEKNRLPALEAEKKDLEKKYVLNCENWKKQLEVLDNSFNDRKMRFEKNISKHVRDRLNYTEFYSELGDYSESVKTILEGKVRYEEA